MAIRGENTSDNREGPRDDVDLDPRSHDSVDRQRSTPRPAPAQFSLGSLLWFMVALSAYFAQLAVVVRDTGSFDAPDNIAVTVVWFVLAVFYLRGRFYHAMVIHCAGLGIILIFAAFAGATATEFTVILLAGCLIGNLVSLPCFVLMLIIWACGHGRPKSW